MMVFFVNQNNLYRQTFYMSVIWGIVTFVWRYCNDIKTCELRFRHWGRRLIRGGSTPRRVTRYLVNKGEQIASLWGYCFDVSITWFKCIQIRFLIKMNDNMLILCKACWSKHLSVRAQKSSSKYQLWTLVYVHLNVGAPAVTMYTIYHLKLVWENIYWALSFHNMWDPQLIRNTWHS